MVTIHHLLLAEYLTITVWSTTKCSKVLRFCILSMVIDKLLSNFSHSILLEVIIVVLLLWLHLTLLIIHLIISPIITFITIICVPWLLRIERRLLLLHWHQYLLTLGSNSYCEELL